MTKPVRTKTKQLRQRASQRGFTLVELALAALVLMVGVVAAAQLVPLALQSNQNNRQDTTATVIAQREIDQMISQPLTATTFTDSDGRVINLGTPATPNAVIGSPAVMNGPMVQINFNVAAVPGYNFTYTDPNNPNGPPYQVRWAVVVTASGGKAVAKRFIVGCWQQNPKQFTQPVTIDSWVQK